MVLSGELAAVLRQWLVLVRINIGNTYDMNQDNQDPAVVKERVKWIKDKGPQRNCLHRWVPWLKGMISLRLSKKTKQMCWCMRYYFFQNLVKMFFGLQHKRKMRENDCEWGVPQKRQIVRNSSSWFSPRNLQDLDTSACRWRGDRVSSLRNVECREGLQLVEWFHRGGFKHLVCLRLLAEMITLSLYLGQTRGFKMFQMFLIFTHNWGDDPIWRACFFSTDSWYHHQMTESEQKNRQEDFSEWTKKYVF